jgi:hypothetical protein
MDYRVGSYETEGLATSFKIYNRALNPKEVQQNFYAQRERFGV